MSSDDSTPTRNTDDDAKDQVAIPEASPEANDKLAAQEKVSSSSRRNLWISVGVTVLILAALVVGITVPLVQKNKNKNDETASASASSTVGDHGPNSDSSSMDGKVTDDDGTDGSSSSMMLTSLPDPIEVADKIPRFGENIILGYDNSEAFGSALTDTLWALSTQVIRRNLPSYQETHPNQPVGGGRPMMMTDAMRPMASMAAGADESASASVAGSGGSSDGITDFGTNNQEDAVEEADIIQADEQFVYAAYGDYILVWDTNGKQVAQMPMPPIVLPEEEEDIKPQEGRSSFLPDPNQWTPKPRINAMLLTDTHLVAIVDGYGPNAYSHGSSMMMDRPILYEYQSTQLRLYSKSDSGVLTFVGHKDINGHYVDARAVGDVVHVATASALDLWTHLYQPLQSYHFVNDTTSSSNTMMEEDEDQYIELALARARDELIPALSRKLQQEMAVNSNDDDDLLLPTMMQINQWQTATPDLGDDWEDDYPDILMDDIVNNVAQVTSFHVNDDLLTNQELDVSASAYLSPSYLQHLYGTADTLILATQDWDWIPGTWESEQTTYLIALQTDGASTQFVSVGQLKGHLLNSYALDVVGNELRAATTVQKGGGWWWGGPRPMPMTMTVGNAVSGTDTAAVEPVEAATTSVSVAAARQSTTEQSQTLGEQCGSNVCSDDEFCCNKSCGICAPSPDGFCTEQFCMEEPEEEEDTNVAESQCVEPDECQSEESYQQCLALESNGCEMMIMTLMCPPQYSCLDEPLASEQCPPPPADGGGCITEENHQDCLDLLDEGCRNILAMESCPLQYDCGDAEVDEPVFAPPEEEESWTENYMIVLNIKSDTAGAMTEKGRVQIGEANERITSVRFFDNIAYAVTFERTDPFYVLDMNASPPEILGELKLPGFSSYLHSMNDDNSLLVAVGQNATDDGRTTGLMVTVFDATNPADPKALVSHTFVDEGASNSHSSSSSQWDYKAFRYLKENGKLIVPVEIWHHRVWNETTHELELLPEGVENFQGFAVLDVSNTSISEQFRVSHTRQEGACRYCGGGAWLPPRSFVYNGDLMSIEHGVVASTDLDTGNEVWRFNLTVEGEASDCCW